MIQPDLEISSTHAATLLCTTLRVTAQSGSPVREFGRIVAAIKEPGPPSFGSIRDAVSL
jgi:hypothetical protein